MINNTTNSPTLGLGGLAGQKLWNLLPGHSSDPRYESDSDSDSDADSDSDSDSESRSIPSVEEAKGKEIYKMIEGIAEWYPLLDPYILAQFPEVAACVGAYYKMALADRKIVSIFMLLDALVDGLDLRFSAL